MRAWLSHTSWKVPKWADTFSPRDSATPYSVAREAGLPPAGAGSHLPPQKAHQASTWPAKTEPEQAQEVFVASQGPLSCQDS